MDMLAFIKSRRSTRKFSEKPVEAEKLEQIIEAGCYAPSGGNNQSWHFLAIERADVLAELARIVESAFCNMTYDEHTYSSLVNSIRLSKRGITFFIMARRRLSLSQTKRLRQRDGGQRLCA